MIGLTLTLWHLPWGFGKSSASSEPFKVGVLCWSEIIPGQVAMTKGLEREAEKINKNAESENRRGVNLIISVAGDGAPGIENQIRQMRGLIHKKVDLIIVQPTDNAALKDPLREANRAGIPVVAYDQYISGGRLESYITSDNYQAGYLNGEFVAASFPSSKKLRIIMVEYPHVSSTVERVNGFLDGLVEHHQRFTILKTYTAVEAEGGKKTAQKILYDFPAKGAVDVLFVINDGAGVSIARKLADSGRSEIFTATIDGDPEAIDIIKNNGMIQIDSAQFCGAIGETAMRTAYNVLLKKSVSKHILIPTFPVTAATLSKYGGWSAPVPNSFKKPWTANTLIWENNMPKK